MSETPKYQLPDDQVMIYDTISENNLTGLVTALNQYKGSVDIFDENGMTPVQHAAYKGNKDMVQLLLDRGANVNLSQHQYNYTALHFAALSGNSEVCQLLLQAGAKASAVNSVGRTAAQMAAFVGNHHTVITINNFVPKSDVTYYAVKHDQQLEPHLPKHLVEPLYKLILDNNIHPVHIAMAVQKLNLLDDLDKLSNILELMSKREMTKGSSTNEIIAFKYHYLSYVLKELNLVKNKSGKEDENKNIVEVFSKKLLKPGKDRVSLDLMDAFLRECIREYPFRECTTFHHMVTTLTSADAPPAYSVLVETINGQRVFLDSVVYCNTCGAEQPAKKCSKCKSVQYCDRECQRLHWFVHKKSCSREVSAPAAVKENVDAEELSKQLQNIIVDPKNG